MSTIFARVCLPLLVCILFETVMTPILQVAKDTQAQASQEAQDTVTDILKRVEMCFRPLENCRGLEFLTTERAVLKIQIIVELHAIFRNAMVKIKQARQ